jgi:hypothetical protein
LEKPIGEERRYNIAKVVGMVRVNLLCLAGVAIALTSLAFPWTIVTSHWYPPSGEITSTEGYRLTDPLNFEGDKPLTLIFEIVVVGGILSIFTPLGGFVQIFGIMNYSYHMRHYSPVIPIPTFPGDTLVAYFSYGPGFYLAILAAIVTLLSILISFGLRGRSFYTPLPGVKSTIRQRLLVWGWN